MTQGWEALAGALTSKLILAKSLRSSRLLELDCAGESPGDLGQMQVLMQSVGLSWDQCILSGTSSQEMLMWDESIHGWSQLWLHVRIT